MPMSLFRSLIVAGTTLWLSACAIHSPRIDRSSAIATRWYAPLPHNGKLTDLSQWWNQLGDPLLSQLIASAQRVSPTLAGARTRIEQARLTRVVAEATLVPRLDVSISATQSSAQPPILPENTTLKGDLQPSWEIDLFGVNRASRDSAQVRVEAAQAEWHEARVSIAAEVANSYYDLRSCEQLLQITRSDATSRAETARLSILSAEAGFVAPATAARAKASAAEGSGRVTLQQAQCDLKIKALVALSAVPEPELQRRLIEAPVTLPATVDIAISSVPAHVLAQRPDVYSAERELVAASFDVGGAQALRFPRLNLSGSVGTTRFMARGVASDLSTWSIGPLTLNTPLFEGGRSRANLQAARARYDEAVIQYQSTVRNAVREVEQALVNLQSTGARGEYVVQAVEGFRTSLGGTESLYQNGLASLYELEESRRTRLAAELAVVSLQQERVLAWIALYRAAGGGWDASQLSVPPVSAESAPAVVPAPFWKKWWNNASQ